MGHVFVSYSRRDVERVDLIVESLLEEGIGVWIDRSGIEAGQTWREQIVEAIDTCEAFILMLSPNSVLSDNVRREIDLALDSKRTIFPLRLEPVELSRGIRYQLTGLQFIDVHQLGFEESMQRLLNTLKKKLTNSPKQKIIIRQSELVIQGNFAAFGEREQDRLMEFLADLCRTDPSSLTIAGTAPGSVHVFVDMPAETAFRLKTMALNREKHLKRFGIASLRLTGDSKFINVALGVLTTTATIGALHLLWLSLPSLLPAVFGVAAGKVIVVTAAVAATTYLGAQVANSISNSPPPASTETNTLTVTPSLPPTGTAPLIPVSGVTEVATEEPSATPKETPTLTPTFTPRPTFTFTFTPSPTDTLTNTPTHTPTDTPTFTPSPTDTPTDTPSPTFTPTLTPSPLPPSPGSFGGFNITNVNLNGSGSSAVVVSDGSLVSVTLDYQVWSQPSCPGCIDQIVIGLEATPHYCAYHGGPGIYPGRNGSNTNTIQAPTASGIYTIYAIFLQYYNCADAFPAFPIYSPGRPIGTITVP
jgi:hypothetical protein